MHQKRTIIVSETNNFGFEASANTLDFNYLTTRHMVCHFRLRTWLEHSNPTTMLKNYFKIAWRSLLKDKQFTFINTLGLSAGLTCAMLIFLWVNDEMSYDKFLANTDRIYQLMENESEESSGLLSETVKQQIPVVEY